MIDQITSYAYCLRIIRRDGVSFYYTNCDCDIFFKGNIYSAKASFDISAIESSNTLEHDNFSISSVIDDFMITDEDIMSGLFDKAKVEIFLVDYHQPNKQYQLLKVGYFSEFKFIDGKFNVEILGMTNKLNTNKVDAYSLTCRAEFCDTKCKLDIKDYMHTGAVCMVLDEHINFMLNVIQPNGFFTGGKVEFTTGKNAGLSFNIKNHLNNTITLYLPTYYPVEVLDEVKIVKGCDKQFKSCINMFNNAVNFRGEPHLPGFENLSKAYG